MKNKFFTNFLMRIAGGGISDSLRALFSLKFSTVVRQSYEGRHTHFARIAAMLLMLLTMSVGQVWG